MLPTSQVLTETSNKIHSLDQDIADDDFKEDDYTDEDEDDEGNFRYSEFQRHEDDEVPYDNYNDDDTIYPSSSFNTPKNIKLPPVKDIDDSPKLERKLVCPPKITDGDGDIARELFPCLDGRERCSSMVKLDVLKLAAVEKSLRELRDSERALPVYNSDSEDEDRVKSLEDLKEKDQCYKDCWEARNMTSDEVIEKIDQILEKSNKDSGFEVTVHKKTIYVEEFGCSMSSGKQIKLCRKYQKRGNREPDSSKATRHFRKLDVLYKLIRNLCKQGYTLTVCSVPYLFEKEKLFRDGQEVAESLNEICMTLGCRRENLNILSSDKGKVIGNFSVKFNNIKTSCADTYFTIKAVEVQKYKFEVESDKDPLAIILVEKDTVFHQLVSAKFHQDFQCIIITGRGQPDIATRIFLRRMRNKLKLPVLALTDGNPHGFCIFHTYLRGSQNMIYDSRNLRTRRIRWLGMRPSDLQKCNVGHHCKEGFGKHGTALKKKYTEDEDGLFQEWRALELSRSQLFEYEISARKIEGWRLDVKPVW